MRYIYNLENNEENLVITINDFENLLEDITIRSSSFR